jgi:glutamate 5-kinase
MVTKIRAARLAARSGTATVIAGGREAGIITRAISGEVVGTFLTPEQQPINARKQWLAGHLQTRGALVLDAGAVNMLKNSGKSLLPVGVKQVRGEFARGAMVICEDMSGNEVARGLENYSSGDAERIIGHCSEEIASLIGYRDEDELIHRDNMVVF